MPTPVDQTEINNTLWRACDSFRGTADPAEYKDYLLTLLFVKYLSDTWKDRHEHYRAQFGHDAARIRRKLERERFILPPESTFDHLYARREKTESLGEAINQALEAIELANKAKLTDVFRNVDFNSESRLGDTKQRNHIIKHLLEDFARPELDLRPSRIGNLDVIGNAYEYLIGEFAGRAGNKAGSFYTPPEVSLLLAKLLDPQAGEKICDPACGSGSLLIQCARHAGTRHLAIYGQEAISSTWALCQMNLFLHDLTGARIEWGDTLLEPTLVEKDQLMTFQVVVANPPFSLDTWGADKADAEAKHFNRWHRGVPPKGKADYAFISHMIEITARDTGRVGVVVPHGVLFRGGAEGRIRQALIEENLLDAVIGLPPNLFFGTHIPAAILLFRRDRGKRTDVLFIDASREFAKGRNHNLIREDVEVARIVETYRARKTVNAYAHVAERTEIADNGYNLSIPRYIDTVEEETTIDMATVEQQIAQAESELDAVRSRLDLLMRETGL